MKLPIIESYWVEENRLLAGEYPGSYDPQNTYRRLDAFLDAGINIFLDLTQSHELAPYESVLKERAQRWGVQASYQRFAIRDHGIPSAETMAMILNSMDQVIHDKGCIYVHCWGGVGRTGVVVACYLIRHGFTNEESLARVNHLYKTRPNNPFFPHSPENREQVEFVLNWQEGPAASHKNKVVGRNK